MKKLSTCFLFYFIYASAFAQQRLILSDDFTSSKNNWLTGEIKDLSVKVQNGKYIIDNRSQSSFNPQIIAGIDSTKDFEISVSIKPLTQDKLSYSGLIFGSNKYHYFCFAINSTGEYGLYEINNYKNYEIIHFTKSSSLKTNENSTNSLKLRKAGKEWQLFINDLLVEKTSSRKLFGPYAGMYCEKIKAEYDDFKITGTSIITSGSMCKLFPLIYQSAKSNFEFVKGDPWSKDDPDRFLLSTELQEEKYANIELGENSNRFFTTLRHNPSKAAAIKYTDSLAAQIKKILPAFIIIRSVSKEGLPSYSIMEKTKPGIKQPVAKLESLNSEDFTSVLSIESEPAQLKNLPSSPSKPGNKVVQDRKAPTSGWLLKDDFKDNRNGWVVDSANTSFATYFKKEMFKNNNEYFLENKDTANARLMVLDKVIYDEKDNYRIEIEINDYTGEDNKGNGIVFGCDKAVKNYYRFVVTQTGSFRIDKVTESGETTMQEWKKSDVIFSNNKLGVMNINGFWDFYINNKQVYFCRSQPLFGTGAGIYVSNQCAIYCKLFSSYDWTVAAKFPAEPKEFIYKNILTDIFRSNENKWSIIDDADVTAIIKDFGYQIENKNSGFYMPVYNSAWTTDHDYVAETRVLHIRGNDNTGYGLSFGKKDVSNAYVFMINNSGYFRIGYYENDIWKDIKGWTENKIIESTPNPGNQIRISSNTLRFESILGEWKFYINDSLVYNCPAKQTDGRGTGFFVEGKQTVDYTNIKINLLSFPSEK